jgi:hypothetical protein
MLDYLKSPTQKSTAKKLLFCAGCTSASLSKREMRAVTTAAKRPETGYQDFVFGASIREFIGLDTLSSEGEGTVYRKKDDSLAFGVVPVERVWYTFKNGGFIWPRSRLLGSSTATSCRPVSSGCTGHCADKGLRGIRGNGVTPWCY